MLLNLVSVNKYKTCKLLNIKDMMNNLQSSAFVAKTTQLLSSVAHLRLLLVMFLTLTASAAWGDTETLAKWTFTSSSYPSNNTNFDATDGTCKTGSAFYLNGSGSTWNTSSGKGYAFTVVNDITITLKLSKAIPTATKITFSADMFYNKDSNAPMTGFSMSVSENGSTFTTTGLDVTSISLSTTSANKKIVYTTQTALAKDATIQLKYTQTGKKGAGQGYFNNIQVVAEITNAPSYTVTATSNNNTYGTVSVSGTTITASPKTGYTYANPAYTVTSGTATVTQNGNTFTVTPSSNCSIRINFAEKVKNTYIDNVQGNSEQALYDSHKTPTLTDKTPATTGTCEQQHWHFMGWVTEANKENPTDANIVKANTSVTANGTTYYAVWAIGGTTNTSKQYSFDITKSNFNTTSYAANNNEKTSTAKASDGSTMSVKWTSNQVMLQSDVMQWQKNTGYIYNSTDLGTINSVTVTSSAGSFTTYYGTSKQPTSNTTVGNGYFQIKVGDATGKTSKVTVTFTQGTSTTTYSDYITSCITETTVSLNPNEGTGNVITETTEETTYKVPSCSFTRTGYEFAKWNTKADGTGTDYEPDDEITLDGTAVNLYAIWTPITYTITYELDGGTNHASNPANYTIETATISLQNPSKTGHNFGGWYKESTFATQVTQIAKGSTGNITLYAKWTANKYDIIYKDQGDVAFSGAHETGYPTQHTYGTGTTLKGATKTGYTFDGWYKEAACTNIVTTLGATEYTGNITLYAKWTEKALTNYRTFCDVVCDAYSFHTGTGEKETWSKEAIKCFTKAEGGYEHEWQIKDYIIPNDDKFFVGNYGYFYNDNLGSGGANGKSRSVVSDWGNMYLAPAMDENDAEGTPRLGHAKGAKGTLRIFEDSNWDNLYVGFIPDGYKLKFGNEEYTFAKTTGTEYRSDVVQYNSTNADKNVGVGVVDADGKYVATNHTQEMRHIFLNTGGASFWEADNVDNFALYDITNETFTCLMHKTGYPNIYEGWVPTTCAKIIFVRLKSSTIDWSNAHNQTVDITLDATKNLYTINTWNQSDNKSGGTWSVYERYGQFAMHDNSKSKNWYVHFVPHYELTYDKNAADATGEMAKQTVAVDAADKKVVVANCGFTRPGYKFVSWRKGETSTYFVAGVNYELVADVTFYAKWEAKKITITWDANGGSVDPTTSTYIYNGTPVELPTPTRANYIFNGWFTATSGGTQIADVGTTNKPTDDVIYYAQWREKAVPDFAWSADSYTAALEADNNYPTLNNPNSLSVTYTSSNTSVATIDANGNITLVATGTTTITATGAESASHKSATDTYELIVGPANCKWVETTTIEDGDEVVITSQIGGVVYALPNTYGTSTPGVMIVNNIKNNEIPSVSNDIKWTIEKQGEQYIFHPNGDLNSWLYCTNSNDGVRVGTSVNKTFAIGQNLESITHVTTGRSIRIGTTASGQYVWRCYTTTSDQTLKLYKRECLDVTKVWVEGNLTNVTCESQLPQQLAKDGSITLTFTAVDGYTLPDNVTVTNATKTWNKSTGTLTISNPTNNVLITIEAVKLHTITWMVGNSSVLSEDVANGTGVTQTPASTPEGDAIGDCANEFMGWSETPLGSAEGQSAPSDLCSAADMKSKHSNVTGNKTFYAVFATKKGSSETIQMYKLVTNISGGKEYIFATGNSAGSVYGLTCDANSNLTATSLTVKTSDDITYIEVPASNNVVWNITSSSSSYNAQNKGQTSKYLRCYGTSPNAVIATSAYALYWSSTKGLYGKSNSGSTSYYLYYDNSTSKWGAKSDASGRVYAFEKSEVTVDNTTYSNYVTNCCALAPATNLTVSGTTSNTATLTWTAPSPTTGITKLQVRNADNDAVVVDDIAVATTTATITGLTECTSYKYYVASVGDCEVFSNTVTAQPFSNAKTVNYDYNGGSGSPASFTTSCEKPEIVLPTATRAGYTFNGWYDAASGGTKVGDAGDTYNPTTSPITLYAQWTIKQYTITWNPNGGNWGGSTSNIVETYEHGATLIQPAAPQRDSYRFTGWSPTVSESVTSDKTYTAQWKQNYTITFHDGDDVTPWTQTRYAESIDLNTYVGTHACGEYNFAGWSKDATKYNDEPANITTWVTGNYTPTANIDLYAVYTKGAVTNDFTLNCAGGVYEIWEKVTNQHMAGRQNGGGDKFYTTEWYNGDCTSCEGTDGAPFTITKVADLTYTLQNADGQYITGNTYDEDNLDIEDTWENADIYKWTISAGSNGTWRFTNKASSEYALVFYDKYFQLRKATNVTLGSDYYDLELTPAAANVYQSNPNCGPYTITFETHGGVFVQGNYKYSTAVTTDLEEPTISQFPAAELDGYTFAGWKDGSSQEDINYEPYLKKADDNLVVSSNKTYHAVYYYYDEEENIDWSKEFTTGIYADVNGTKYFLAGTPARGTMSSTTDCGYVSEVTITPGTGANAGKYKITVNSVGLAPESGETDLVAGTAWWTITETSVGSGEYKISGEDKRNIVLRNSSFGHYSYNAGSSYGAGYYYPRFGKCLEHHWTSDPPAKPSIKLSGEVYVTATNARGIMATSTLKVSAKQLNANEKVNITSNSNDVYFSTDCTVNFVKANKPTKTLTITASPSGVIEQDIYVHYKPSAEGNGTPESVVVSANLETPDPSVTDDQTIYVRNLPDKFVIATKVGAIWYALPADMREATNPLGVVIEVDETTMTTIAPNTTTYTLWPVKTTATEKDRYTNATGAAYGDRVRFAAVNYDQRGLWANNNNNGSTIRDYAKIDALGDEVLAAYEWKITTTVVDGHWQYTLQTDQDKNQNFLRYWTSAEGTPVGPKWGTYNAGENKLYFLPVTEAQPFDYDVVEWYPTKVLIQTDAAITSPTVKVNGVAVASPTLTNKGGKLYEISNLPLETNPNKLLQISFTDNAINYINTKVVPIILSRGAKTIKGEPFASLTQKVYQYADVVVRDGATLSINGDTHVANTLFGVTIYPTAKVSVAEDKKLSVHSLTFFGGIDEIYNGSSYEINKYGVPQLSLKGTLNKTVTTIDYIMRVDLEQMYQVGVPYDVNLNDITYWDGTAMTLGDNLYVSAYDGQKRANLESAWVWEIYWEEEVMKAGIGYTISADMQSGVGNEYSIIRLPMKSNVASGKTEAEEDKTVKVYAYDNKNGVEITDNSKGWNFLSNPYMTAISGADGSDLIVSGYLSRNDVTEPWVWVEEDYRYVTIPSDDGTYHYQQKFSKATLYPFKSFFLQIAIEGTLSFELASRQSAPARYLQTNNKKREVEFEVLLANDTRSDNLGLLISEAYTPAYEINADLEKMIGSMSVYTIYNGYNLAYNALSPTNAEEQIPIGYVVPTVGEYTWALDESSNVEDIEHIYLYDYETSVITDLLTDVYTFTASEQKSDTRFAINVTLKSKDSTVTGLVNVNKDSEQSVKFIYNDKIYILHNGVIYDATGKFVETINK